MEDGQQVARMRTSLANRLGGQRYELWFGAQSLLSVQGDVFTAKVPSAFVRDWIRKNYKHDLQACCQEVFGRAMELAFEVDGSLLLPNQRRRKRVATDEKQTNFLSEGSPSPAESAPSDERTGPATIRFTGRFTGDPRSKAKLNRPASADAMTFSNLVVGEANQFSVHSAEMVAGGLHQASPVVFWGPTGVGKTHILRATRNAFRRAQPRSRSVYFSAEQFTTQFVQALRGSGLPSFRQKCRGADLLLIDDIHFLLNKRATLEELLHTMDAVAAAGGRLVLSCDRPLGQLQNMGAELVSRLAAGAVCEIQPPDFDMRVQILRTLADRMKFPLDEKLLVTIATQMMAGAREMQGVLNRLQLMSRATSKSITATVVDAALSDIAQQNSRPLRLGDIQKAVCDVFGVEATGLRSDGKSRSLSEPRMLAMWLARKHTRAPWSEIGEFFGRRSHSTVISAHRRVERLMSKQESIGLSNQPCRVEDAIRRVETALRMA